MSKEWAKLIEYPCQVATYSLRWSSVSIKKTMALLSMASDDPVDEIIMKMVAGIALATSFYSAQCRAVATGKVLAILLRDRWVINKAPVSFIGFSLGTQVITSCLQQLAEWKVKIVQDVTFMGSAVDGNDMNSLIQASEAINGRFINVFSYRDLVLKYMFNIVYSSKAVGLGPLNIAGVVNINATEIGGHLDYRKNMDKILKMINYSP